MREDLRSVHDFGRVRIANRTPGAEIDGELSPNRKAIDELLRAPSLVFLKNQRYASERLQPIED